MSDDIVEGSYVNVKDESFVKYLIKSGVPAEDAEKTKGTHWSSRLEKTKEGRYVAVTRVEECPELNSVDTYTVGKPKQIEHPLFGGKATINFERTGSDSFKCWAKSEKFGTTEWTEKYSEDGIQFDIVHKESGATLKEFWCRKHKTTGWFECVKMEGVEAYNKAAKPPIDFDPNDLTMRVGLEKCGDVHVMTECFGEHSIVSRIRLDEEMTYAPGTPFEGKMLVTKISSNACRFIYVTSRGEEHWDMTFTTKGLNYTGVHKPSGATCKMWFEPICNIFGKYKLVSSHNEIAYGQALGMPAELTSKLMSESSARLNLSDAGDGWMRFRYESKIVPMDLAFKFNQEFDYALPAMLGGEKYKILFTREGNVIQEMWTGEKATVVTKSVFTGNWLINTESILGTDIWSKKIYKRC